MKIFMLNYKICIEDLFQFYLIMQQQKEEGDMNNE